MNTFIKGLISLLFLIPFDSNLHSHARKDHYNLAFAAIFRDEGPYLKEWIEFHKIQGAEHFYLYNNLSQDNYLDVLKPYIDSGEVELTEWPYESYDPDSWHEVQDSSYRDALARATGKVTWLALCDVDEFFVPIQYNKLKDLLNVAGSYGHVGGVRAWWIMIGSSGVEKIPDDKLMIETLTKTAQGPSSLFKSIVKPERVRKLLNSHEVLFYPGLDYFHAVYPIMQINHYWARDLWFLDHIKKPRRAKSGISPEMCNAWDASHNFDTKHHLPIQRFVPELRKRMGLE